jgi:hypothetical protein
MTQPSHLINDLRHGIDGLAVMTVVGGLMDLLPPVAAGFSIAWFILQMIDRHRRIKKERKEEQKLLTKVVKDTIKKELR